jgi:hypothetical protein
LSTIVSRHLINSHGESHVNVAEGAVVCDVIEEFGGIYLLVVGPNWYQTIGRMQARRFVVVRGMMTFDVNLKYVGSWKDSGMTVAHVFEVLR